MLVVKEEFQDLPQCIILPLQFNIKAILNGAYRGYNMILPAFNIADELRTFVNHNLRGLVDDFRVCEHPHRLHDEIKAVLLRVALCVQKRPVLALGFHLLAAHGGDTFLHEFGFLDAPRLVDFGCVHRHLVGARTDHVESSVFFCCSDIQVTCHRELLAFRVFRHLREEAGELDKIAGYFVLFENFVTFDIGEVFARGLVFESEILRGHVAYIVAVGGDVYFDGVIFVGEIGVCDVDGNTT